MPKRRILCGLGLLTILAFACWARGDAAEEIGRLAKLMDWKPGDVVADIGAGDGSYSFAAAERVGAAGRVYATEIDAQDPDEVLPEKRRVEAHENRHDQQDRHKPASSR